MDSQSKQMLDEILAKEPAALTDADKEFLRARSTYLNEEQRSVYAEVLSEHPEADKGHNVAEAEPASKRVRKGDK